MTTSEFFFVWGLPCLWFMRWIIRETNAMAKRKDRYGYWRQPEHARELELLQKRIAREDARELREWAKHIGEPGNPKLPVLSSRY